jgi:hypothetical protein
LALTEVDVVVTARLTANVRTLTALTETRVRTTIRGGIRNCRQASDIVMLLLEAR